MVKIDNIVRGLRDNMVEQAIADLDGSNAQIKLEDYTKHRDMLLKAYNVMECDERDREGYVYCADNNEDMNYLLKNGFSVWDIRRAVCDGYPYIVVNNNGKLENIDGITLEKVLRDNMSDLMDCVIIYAPYTSEYAEVYKEYVSMRLDRGYEREC